MTITDIQEQPECEGAEYNAKSILMISEMIILD